MRTDLLRDVVGWTLTKLPHAHGLIGSDGEDGAPIGGEAGIEHGRVVFVVHWFQRKNKGELSSE